MEVRASTLVTSLLGAWLLACCPVRAENTLTLVPYVEAGLVDYSLGFDGTFPLPGEGEGVFRTTNQFKFNASMAKLGLAAAVGDFYANIHYRASTEGTDTQVTQGAQSIKWNGDRTESAVAVGYNVTDVISVFVGYRDSEAAGDGTGDSSYTFAHNGYFLGASYYLELTQTGGLTFSAGYAWLDAELDETILGLRFPDNKGDGSGAKVGVNWRDLFNTQWGYSLSVEYFDYDYDLSGEGGIIFDMEEKEAVFSVGLFYLL